MNTDEYRSKKISVNPWQKLFLIVLALLSVTTYAQNAPKQDDDVIKVKSNLVNIDVTVKDKKGKYISDLKPEDFSSFESVENRIYMILQDLHVNLG